MEKRTLLAVVLSMAVIMLYHFLFQPPAPPIDNTTTGANALAANASGVAEKPAVPTSIAVGGGVPPSPPIKATGKRFTADKDIEVETPLYKALFSSRGASLRSLQLKKYSQETAEGKNPLEMVAIKSDSHLPLALTFVESSINIPHDLTYTVNTNKLTIGKNDGGKEQLVFTASYDKIKVEKIFSFQPNSYGIELELKITNLADVTLSQQPVLLWYANDEQNGKSREHIGAIYYLFKDVKRVATKDVAAGKMDGPHVRWAGWESKYFLAAIAAPNPDLASVSLSKETDGNTVIIALLSGTKLLVPPKETVSSTFSLFIGPKEYDALSQQNLKLENAVDFGFFRWLAAPMLVFLKFLHGYIPNYGIAIIILATLIKLIFWPLGNISYRSMKKMQELQPKMKEIQEKYKNDKQKLGQETMALYKAHKVNPMGGCLPILVQLPVFIALFNAIQYSIELRQAPFFLWITDLSVADPYYVTPILMGATMFIQQKMSPPPPDPMQAKIMMFLPLIFTFFFLNFSSGLVLYWLFNNILSIAQQLYVNKKLS